MKPYRIGIDIGGSKIELRMLDDADSECFNHRIPTPTGTYEEALKEITELVSTARKRTQEKPVTIGLGIPGALDPVTKTIKNTSPEWLLNQPFDHDLAISLGQEVRISNDANCFTLSESYDGAAAGASTVFGVIIGTGTGGGLVIHGAIHAGAQTLGGEWGHNPFPVEHGRASNRRCFCGKLNCIETFTSGRGLSANWHEEFGETLTAQEINQRWQQSDPKAMTVMDRYFDQLAAALATIINVVDPNVIVFGGGLSNIQGLTDQISDRIGKFIFSCGGSPVRTKFAINKWGDASGARGAARLWEDTE